MKLKQIIKEFFKSPAEKQAEFYDSFERFTKHLIGANGVEIISGEQGDDLKVKKVILNVHGERTVIEASHYNMVDGFTKKQDFLGFISCNGVHTSKVHDMVEAIKSGNPQTAVSILTAQEVKVPNAKKRIIM